MDHLSPTQISCFLRCPKQWEFRYLKGLKIPPSGAMVLGSSYHEGLAAGFQYILKTQEQPPQDLLFDTFDTSFERIKLEHLVKDEDDDLEFDEILWDEEPDKLKDTGIELLEAYRERIMPAITPVTVEDRIEIQIDGVNMVMITDLVTARNVIDHKVKSRRFPEDELKRDVQATAYSMSLAKPFEFHVALKNNNPEVIIQKAERTERDKAFFIEQVTKVWKAIQAGIFFPNTQGWWCSERWCGYYQICRGR